MHVAAASGAADVVRLLLARGFDANLPTGAPPAATPLMAAVVSAKDSATDAAQVLLAAGANLEQRDAVRLCLKTNAIALRALHGCTHAIALSDACQFATAAAAAAGGLYC